ncbi:MAG: stage V sporulation protein AD [Bacilli bacterium]
MSSFKYSNVFLKDSFTIVGPLEKKGRIKGYNLTMNDYYNKESTFEKTEIEMQKTVIDNLLYNNKLIESNIDLLIGGDLINQNCITNTCASKYHIPYFGIYNACATFNESLIIAANFITSNTMQNIICVTSSHNLTAERQYRYPIEYGPNRKLYSSHTVTGAIAALVSGEKSKVKIESSTIGESIDYGITDANNMGAIMAPAAADTLFKHLNDLERNPNYYDLILTGDLGKYGSILFKEISKRKYKLNVNNHEDAGCLIYNENQNVYAGGSGPVCLPLVLFNKILKEKKYKKILLLATGSLHSKVMVDQHMPLTGICHAVSLEVTK